MRMEPTRTLYSKDSSATVVSEAKDHSSGSSPSSGLQKNCPTSVNQGSVISVDGRTERSKPFSTIRLSSA
jgi:hypothetical protein